mgnify:CR=1 FL=1
MARRPMAPQAICWAVACAHVAIGMIEREEEFAQRSEREVTTGTTAGDLFDGERDVVVARVNGQLRDLAWVLADPP